MDAALRLTVAALAMLVCGFAGLGLSLLVGPFTDPNTLSGGYFFLFVAAGLVVVTVAMLRGNQKAWLTACIASGLVVLLPVALWVSEVMDDLGEGTELSYEQTATAVVSGSSSPALALGELSGYVVFVSAAWAAVMLLLPSTRVALAQRRG